tara:strand:- start:151 stop:645 length:495 start_codon:yes stop_codon:yes gene_type:complete
MKTMTDNPTVQCASRWLDKYMEANEITHKQRRAFNEQIAAILKGVKLCETVELINFDLSPTHEHFGQVARYFPHFNKFYTAESFNSYANDTLLHEIHDGLGLETHEVGDYLENSTWSIGDVIERAECDGGDDDLDEYVALLNRNGNNVLFTVANGALNVETFVA